MAGKKRPLKKSSKFVHEDPWRVFRIMSEFVEGFDEMSHIGPAVTIFGSARTKPRDRFYKATVDISRRLAENNYAVITGGGPGIMEAANRGAADVNRELSMGYNIELPHEQGANAYISDALNFEFKYFFMRKFWFMNVAKALIIFPGGFGTMDELFEMLTLIQTGKQPRIPVVLYGKNFWERLINFDVFVEMGLIAERDIDLFHRADSVDDAFDFLTGALAQDTVTAQSRHG